MNEDEGKVQPDILKRALFDCVDSHVDRYKLTFAEVIGILECVKDQYIKEMRES